MTLGAAAVAQAGSLPLGRNFCLFRRWRCTRLLRQVVRWTARDHETGDDRLADHNHADGNEPGEQQLDPQRHGGGLSAWTCDGGRRTFISMEISKQRPFQGAESQRHR